MISVRPFIQAHNYTPASRRPRDLDLIVLHSTESQILKGVARAVAGWLATPDDPPPARRKGSAHYVVGPDEQIQTVRLEDVAWGAPKTNKIGVHVEQVGQALKTDWLSAGTHPTDGLAVLEASASLVAELAVALNIPIRRVTVEGIRARERGITTHATATAAWAIAGGNGDPGGPHDERWPWAEYLRLVEAAARPFRDTEVDELGGGAHDELDRDRGCHLR